MYNRHTDEMSLNQRKPVAQGRNVLYLIKEEQQGEHSDYWKPRGYAHSCGVLVWYIAPNCFGLYRVGEGWTFLTHNQWVEKFITAPPEHLGLTNMAILGYLTRKVRSASLTYDNLSASTLVHALRTAVPEHTRAANRHKQEAALQPA